MKNDKKVQAKIFAQNMKRQRDIQWLENRLIEISGRPGYELEEKETIEQLSNLKGK